VSQPTVADVVKSGAVIWFADVDTTKPTATNTDYNENWPSGWTRLGYTSAPVALAYESTEMDITVEEELAAIDRVRVAEAATIETTIAELTAEYFALAAGGQTIVTRTAQSATVKGNESTGLGGVANIEQQAWGVEGLYLTKNGVNEPIRFFFHKGTAMLNGPMSFSQKDTETTGVTLQIKALADTTQNAGQKLVQFYRVLTELS